MLIKLIYKVIVKKKMNFFKDHKKNYCWLLICIINFQDD